MKKKKKMLIISIIAIVIVIIIATLIIMNVKSNNEPIIVEETKLYAYNNPIVPQGFKKVETESASWEIENSIPKGWNTGLVIEDEKGNQFVWIPKIEIKDEILLRDIEHNLEELQEPEQKEEHQNKLNEQIEKYGGFYIARYEAGVTDEMQNSITEYSASTNDIVGMPVSKKGQIPWNFISLKNAKINAQSMYKENNQIESDLVSPIQWIHLMQWLSNSGLDIQNSSKYGNFSNNSFRFTGLYSEDFGKTYLYTENKLKWENNIIIGTGASEQTKFNNIYDFAGNVMEYTDGWVRARGYYSVGGYFDTLGNYGIYSPSLIGVTPLERLGYRVVLYIN